MSTKFADDKMGNRAKGGGSHDRLPKDQAPTSDQIAALERSYADSPSAGSAISPTSSESPKFGDPVSKNVYDDSRYGQPKSIGNMGKTGAPNALGKNNGEAAERKALGASGSKGGSNEKNFGFKQGDSDPSRGARFKNMFWGNKFRKRSTSGGIVAMLLMGGGFSFFSIVSGPFQFAQIAHILHNTHFSQQENASNSRVGNIVRYTSTGERGETRLNNLASAYHSRIVSKLKAAGINMEYKGPGGTLSRVTVDTSNRSSSYFNKSESELKAAGFKPVAGQVGVYEQNPNGFFSERGSQHAAMQGIKGNMAVTAVRNRIFGKFGMANLSPLTAVNRGRFKTTAALNDYFKKKWNNMFKGIDVSVTATGDKNKQPTPEETERLNAQNRAVQGVLADASGVADELADTGDIGNNLGRFGQGLLGPVAAAQSIVCPFVAVNENVKALRYAMVILPLIQAGMDIMSVGYEIATGQNVSMAELSYLASKFVQRDTTGSITGKKGTVLNNWFDAKSIRENQGLKGGVDALGLNGTNELLKGDGDGHVKALAMFNNNISELGCTVGAQIAGGVASAVMTVLSFGTDEAADLGVTAIAKAAIKAFVQDFTKDGVKATTQRALTQVGKQGAIYYGEKYGIELLTNLLKGEAISIASGAEFGGDIDYGAALAANASNLALGGVALTKPQIAQLNTRDYEQQQLAFDNESLSSRLFNPYDSNSLLSRVAIDAISPSFIGNLSNFASFITNIGPNLLNAVSSIFTPAYAASPPQPYDYPFPIYGFSEDDLNSQTVQDPLANASYVGNMLTECAGDSSCTDISEAEKCFPVSISQVESSDGTGKVWDVIPTNQGLTGTFNPYDPDNYSPSECQQPSGIAPDDWLRLRFFILDTGAMEGYACGEFNDAASCANDGVDDSSSASQSVNPGQTEPGQDASADISGDSAQLAQQILNNKNVNPSPSAQNDLEAAAQGKMASPGPNGDGSSGVAGSSNCQPVNLNPGLLRVILALSQKYTFYIQDIVSGHQCDTAQHPKGRAMDVFKINGQSLNDSWWANSANKSTVNDWANIVGGANGYQEGFGVGCSAYGKVNAPSNVYVFPDSGNFPDYHSGCSGTPRGQDEIHIDVRGAP